MSLGPASRLLGVDPDTLRRWADDGRVQAWTTPGGHRRFDRRALERLAADRRPGGSPPLASLGASSARLNR
ncbi:MAG: helix-turn-helix domain-containing protein, partial [Chloroflexi bacterium]|nr:helix-turn-helix domain-containing protein [Chloroflexota bacterium]